AAIERMVALLDQSLPAGPSPARHRVAFYRLWLEEQALLTYITDPQGIRMIYAGEELEVFTDLPKLQQIYHNLLRNAIEAALPGDQIVTRVVGQPEGIMLLVQNPRLVGTEVDVAAFQPFVSSKGEGHQGMGLAVCRHLAALLGAEIGYRPDSGFWVRLPVSRSD
ncbi:sensor histidine kinase, partial [Methylacidiphilum caldifontis]|uniref:sensor histidine kinase n=1 Tax=Methylacidiphilum caldifontis TaxID=2795386 RepID=UPI00106CAB1B